MPKDHREHKERHFKRAPDGVFEASEATSNKMPTAPHRFMFAKGQEPMHDGEKKKLWEKYWEGVQMEFDAWDMHYKRQKWQLPGEGK